MQSTELEIETQRLADMIFQLPIIFTRPAFNKIRPQEKVRTETTQMKEPVPFAKMERGSRRHTACPDSLNFIIFSY
jgi:hypothetical protein